MTSKGRVLVVDDEHSIRRAVGRALTARGYDVQLATDGEEALSVAAAFQPDLVVLDLNLPALDGLSVCRQLRVWSSVPILVLSVREDEADKVAALDLGADDYLTKPFGIDELLARVRALLRRAGAQGAPKPVRFHTDELEIDLDTSSVTRAGAEVRLTKTEWALLTELCQHPGKLLTHRWLLERVWGPGYAEDVDVLRVFVSQLRKSSNKIRHGPNSSRPTRASVTDGCFDPPTKQSASRHSSRYSRSVWSRSDRRRAPGYGSGDWLWSVRGVLNGPRSAARSAG